MMIFAALSDETKLFRAILEKSWKTKDGKLKWQTFKRMKKDFDGVSIFTTPESAEENLETFFARKIYKPFVREYDFRIKEDRSGSIIDCEKLCGLKGISINICNEKSRDAAIRKYKTTGNFSPKNKDSICIFKFNKSAGLTQHTPSNTDKFH